MFEGEKREIFWLGLTILGLASVGLFGILRMVAVVMYPANSIEFLKGSASLITGGFFSFS